MTTSALQTRNCRWLDVRGAVDARGRINFLEVGQGACRVHLDDGRTTEAVTIDDPGRALYVGTWVWHELTDFTDGAAILVIASTLYDEAEYLRDYETFKREAKDRP